MFGYHLFVLYKSLGFVTYDMFPSILVDFVYLFCFMLNQCRAGWVMGGRGFLINSPGTASCLLLAALAFCLLQMFQDS